MARLTARPATAGDIREYFGEEQPMTLRALVVDLDGEPAGVIGLARQGPVARFFSEFRPALRPYLKTITALRTVKAAMSWVKASRIPVYALAQCDEPDAHRILARLGFVRQGEGVYIWPN